MESQAGCWVEFVQDLWKEDRLKHLWDVAMPYVNDHQFEFDPATQMYGFQSLQCEDDIAEKSLSFTHTEEDEGKEREQPISSQLLSTTKPQETTKQPSTLQQLEEAPKSKRSSCMQILP